MPRIRFSSATRKMQKKQALQRRQKSLEEKEKRRIARMARRRTVKENTEAHQML